MHVLPPTNNIDDDADADDESAADDGAEDSGNHADGESGSTAAPADAGAEALRLPLAASDTNGLGTDSRHQVARRAAPNSIGEAAAAGARVESEAPVAWADLRGEERKRGTLEEGRRICHQADIDRAKRRRRRLFSCSRERQARGAIDVRGASLRRRGFACFALPAGRATVDQIMLPKASRRQKQQQQQKQQVAAH